MRNYIYLPLPRKWLVLLIIVLIFGIFFRFANIDKKIYWHDETYTSLRIAGYTEQEVIAKTSQGITVSNLKKYQYPNSEKTAFDTIKTLAIEEPQLPPLYFLVTRFWVKLFGNSVLIIRTISVIFSLLSLFYFYQLCRELSDNPYVSWIGLALISISPFDLIFAQEARPYSLLSLMVLLSSVSLLKAIRSNSKIKWIIYTITLILGLYSHLFFGLVIISQCIYLFCLEKFILRQIIRNYLLAAFTAILCSFPWIFIVFTNLSQVSNRTNWIKSNYDLIWLFKAWIVNLSRIFFDINNGFSNKNPIFYMAIILIFYSIYFLVNHTHKKTWIFILSLIGVTAISLVLLDLIFRTIISSASRYLIPCYLGIELSVAYLLGTKITSSSDEYQLRFWKFLMAILITCGVISCASISQAQVWWNKDNPNNPSIAKIINQTQSPLLMSESSYGKFGDLMSLTYLLKPEVKILTVDKKKVPKIDDFTNIFVYSPSQELRNNLTKIYTIKTDRKNEELNIFKLEPKH